MIYNAVKRNNNVRWGINRHKNMNMKAVKIKASITFLIRCRKAGIIPDFISDTLKNVCNIFDTGNDNYYAVNKTLNTYMENFQNKLLNLLIRHKHNILKDNQKESETVKEYVNNQLCEEERNNIWLNENSIAQSMRNKVNEKQRKKFEKLRQKQRDDLGIHFNDNWFVNTTNTVFPEDSQWLLSLGEKYNLPTTRRDFPIVKYIADGEDLIHTIKGKEEQESARTKLTYMIDNHMNKMRENGRDKFILRTVVQTRHFLNKNKNILILNADKGNVTVAMDKLEYNERMMNILGDMMTYQRINKDPTSNLQKQNNQLVEELFTNNIISQTQRRQMKTEVSTAPRIYGLPKIHKQGYPLRPICSSINAPSTELCKYMVNILKNLTEDSKYNVKDSMQFKKKIKDLTIHDDEKMISFDVVSLFPSIPVDLALKIIEEKWNDIQEYTNMTKSLFLRIIKFCIKDNRYFKY